MAKDKKRRNKKHDPIKLEYQKLFNVRLSARESAPRAPDGSRYIDGLHSIEDMLRLKRFEVPWFIRITLELIPVPGEPDCEIREIMSGAILFEDLFELFNNVVNDAREEVGVDRVQDIRWTARPVTKQFKEKYDRENF